MKKILNNNLHFIVIGIIAILVVYWYLRSLSGLKDIVKRPKYTIALIVSDWHHKDTNGIGVDYEYYVNGTRYLNTTNLDTKKGERYLLVYDSLRPENNVVLDIYPIHNLSESPLNGWNYNKVPIEIDSLQIKTRVLESK